MADNVVRRNQAPLDFPEVPMHTISRSPLSLFAALSALVLCACATVQLGENLPPPRFVVGDHWEYLVTDGLRRGATTRLDVQVVAVNSGVATMRLVSVDSYGQSERMEEIDADGGLRVGALRNAETRRFSPSLKLRDFPSASAAPGGRPSIRSAAILS
jgi:hypothetical protein